MKRLLTSLSLLLAIGVGSFGSAWAQSGDPFIFVTPTAQASDPSSDGWTGMQFAARPLGTSIAGHTVAELNSYRDAPLNRWCHVSPVTARSFVSPDPRVQAAIDATFREHPNVFTVSGNFTGSGAETATLGMYSRCEGSATGLFILFQSVGPPRRLLHVQALNPEMTFAHLWVNEGDVNVGDCFACDVFSALRYDRGRRRFYWEDLTPGNDD